MKRIKSTQLLSLICFCLIILIWCLASYSGSVSEIFLPTPTAVVNKIASMANSKTFYAEVPDYCQ